MGARDKAIAAVTAVRPPRPTAATAAAAAAEVVPVVEVSTRPVKLRSPNGLELPSLLGDCVNALELAAGDR
jgi:hypothetical protein